jgi:hypothetical protein
MRFVKESRPRYIVFRTETNEGTFSMSGVDTQVSPSPAWASFEAIRLAGDAARAARMKSGEIMIYMQEGWVVREYPDGRVERLAPVESFRDQDFPYPA